MLDRCAKEPEFIMAIIHETPERPNEFVFYELWKGTRAEFDATQGTKPYRKAYIENTKKFLEKVGIEWNSPILEWGTNLTGLNQSCGRGGRRSVLVECQKHLNCLYPRLSDASVCFILRFPN